MVRLVLIAGVAALAWPTVAAAHDPNRQHRHFAQAPGHDPLDCYCLAQGRRFAPGELICLRTPQGGRMAECRMEINVMSWGMTERACPES